MRGEQLAPTMLIFYSPKHRIRINCTMFNCKEARAHLYYSTVTFQSQAKVTLTTEENGNRAIFKSGVVA